MTKDLRPGLPEAKAGAGGNWRDYPAALRQVVRLHRHQRAVARETKRPRFHDPVTGDVLTLSEEVSWLLQGIIRRWTVIIAITAFTAWAWWRGHIWHQPLTDIWNLFASYWAVLLESVVGIAMFSSARRDAVVMRETQATARRLEEIERRQNLILTTLCSYLDLEIPEEERPA